jgi:hypothetical protein
MPLGATQRPGHWCGPSCCFHPPHTCPFKATSTPSAAPILDIGRVRIPACIGCLYGRPRRILSTTIGRVLAS